MDVFVIPTGRDRYELYSEASSDAEFEDEAVDSGVLGRIRRYFVVTLRTVEDRQQRRGDSEGAGAGSRVGFMESVRNRILGWAGRRLAEERLLWSLRRQTSVVAVHPEDMTFEQVLPKIHRVLRRDGDRHRIWFVAHFLGFVASGPIAIVPGPNLIAYFFAFRMVGHWLSMRGATQGLRRISWSGRPCSALTDLRDVPTLASPDRDARISDVATRLQLSHLTRLFNQAAAQPVVDSPQQS
ncbi:MAG: hypothetical protein O2930_10615 [Acidobacteria bacterium]|nr:hypothetical protein [Acidobacteriota bacterium]